MLSNHPLHFFKTRRFLLCIFSLFLAFFLSLAFVPGLAIATADRIPAAALPAKNLVAAPQAPSQVTQLQPSYFVYTNFASVDNLNLLGVATQTVGSVLRLTPNDDGGDLAATWGGAWYIDPQAVAEGFRTTFQYRITDLQGAGADGFAFVIQNADLNATGTGGCSVGYQPITNSLAIEFDTYQNGPVGSSAYCDYNDDPNANHIGVHTRGPLANSADEEFSIGTVTPAINISDGFTHTVTIEYVTETLKVYLDDPFTPILITSVNLSETLDLDQGRAWVGFVGAIATHAENHDIITWEWSSGDADGDGLYDIWETQGLTVTTATGDVFVDLPAMGADPLHKDIFIEVDYMVNAGGASLQPVADVFTPTIEAYADSPLTNPDGTTGVTVHVDYGSNGVMDPTTGAAWGSLSDSEAVPWSASTGSWTGSTYEWADFDLIKDIHFNPARAQVFHYAVFVNEIPGRFGGVSRGIEASDFLVSLGSSFGTVNQQAAVFMHELGHNVGLHHGGDTDRPTYEPNYLSVMNYIFIYPGLMINGTDGHYDYSRFTLPDLAEASLTETVGLNGGPAIADYGTAYFCPLSTTRTAVPVANDPINWNCDTDTSDTFLEASVNRDVLTETLHSYNDWANIKFHGGSVGQPAVGYLPPMQTTYEEFRHEDAKAMKASFDVQVDSRGYINLASGSGTTVMLTIQNIGLLDDTYDLSGLVSSANITLAGVPLTVTLKAGASFALPVYVTVADSTSPGTEEMLLWVLSQGNPNFKDAERVRLFITDGYQIFIPFTLR